MRRPAAALALVAGLGPLASVAGPREDLQRTQAAARIAGGRAVELETAAAAAGEASTRARAAAIAVAARIQASEADIAAAEARIQLVEAMRKMQRARLAEKQGPTVRLVAALQSLTLRPPVLALAQRGSIADLVHVHAVLAGVLPILRARTIDLRADVERGRRLRVAADQALAARHFAQQALVAQQRQLLSLEAARRTASSEFASRALAEQDRVMAMGEQARDLGVLMAELDNAARGTARLAALPGPLLRPARPGAPTMTSAAAPTLAIPAYRLPVIGNVVVGMGEVSAAGIRARGLTIATQPRAQVVAPTSGHIAFAGPFRAYGQIVVIDHGLGWTTLITNLAALNVRTGDEVDRGAPVGRTGDGRPTVTVELRRLGQPVDIARLAG